MMRDFLFLFATFVAQRNPRSRFLWTHKQVDLALHPDIGLNMHVSGMSHVKAASLNHPSGHLGGWSAPRSAEEMLDEQGQRVDAPAHAGTAHDGLPPRQMEEDLC